MLGFDYQGRLTHLSKKLTRAGLDEFLEEQFAAISPGSLVLSVGAGGPICDRLSRHAKANGFNVIYIDVDSKRGPDIVADINHPNFAADQFDAVVVCEVLEHVESPDVAVRHLTDALKPAGHMIVTTPFLMSLHNRPRDFYRFTEYGLRYLFRDFTTVTVSGRNSWASAIAALPARLVKEKSARAKLIAPFCLLFSFTVRPLAACLDRLVPVDSMPTGYNCVAQRKTPTDMTGVEDLAKDPCCGWIFNKIHYVGRDFC